MYADLYVCMSKLATVPLTKGIYSSFRIKEMQDKKRVHSHSLSILGGEIIQVNKPSINLKLCPSYERTCDAPLKRNETHNS